LMPYTLFGLSSSLPSSFVDSCSNISPCLSGEASLLLILVRNFDLTDFPGEKISTPSYKWKEASGDKSLRDPNAIGLWCFLELSIPLFTNMDFKLLSLYFFASSSVCYIISRCPGSGVITASILDSFYSVSFISLSSLEFIWLALTVKSYLNNLFASCRSIVLYIGCVSSRSYSKS
jgi:hypothetical protein